MRRAPFALFISLLLCAVAAGCSDDDNPPPTEAGPDKAVPDGPAAGELGPGEGGPVEGGAPDVGPDAGNPCDACKSDEICVQSFDGTCFTGPPSCITVSASCKSKVGTPGAGCASECEAEFCTSPFQCQNQAPCGTEVSGVDIYCYGP